MPMPRFAQRDANEKPIVDALRKAGAFVWRLDQPMDLLVWVPWQRRFVLLEVKNPENNSSRKNRIKPSQIEANECAPEATFFVSSIGEALAAIEAPA
jgi:hypothetical protein